MTSLRAAAMWAALAVAIVGPLAVAATSPLLEWRGPVYISAGFAGIIAMACLLLQPLLAGGALPGLALRQSRIVHRIVGAGLFLAIVWHVGALWITSPPDVVDALLFRSPTPFSAWGVIAMWAAFAAAALAALRKRIRLRPMTWRRLHASLAALCVGGSAVHAVLIDGTMGTVSKWMLCALSVAATIKLIVDLRIWSPRARRDA